jgi:hypothetical protein
MILARQIPPQRDCKFCEESTDVLLPLSDGGQIEASCFKRQGLPVRNFGIQIKLPSIPPKGKISGKQSGQATPLPGSGVVVD